MQSFAITILHVNQFFLCVLWVSRSVDKTNKKNSISSNLLKSNRVNITLYVQIDCSTCSIVITEFIFHCFFVLFSLSSSHKTRNDLIKIQCVYFGFVSYFSFVVSKRKIKFLVHSSHQSSF